MTENEARQMEVEIEWNGKANVCTHCGKVPETYYIATGHDHTDDSIRYCFCRVQAKTIEQLSARVAPIPPELAAQLERTDWTPEEALRFYADQKNYDIAGSHVRMIDTGAIASNALKHLSVARLEMKGDAELFELREQLASAQADNKRLRDAFHNFERNKDEWDYIFIKAVREILAQPSDTSALDAYVAEKVKEAKQTAVSEFLEKTGKYVTNDASRSAAIEAATTSLNEEIRMLKDAVDNLADGELKARNKLAELTHQRDLAVAGIEAVAALIQESTGVAGLHLNGDIATWEELRTGGRFEEWLCLFDEALAQPSDTSALDAYVAEKVKEAVEEADDQILATKNLLAIMHRDGGHHEFAVGFDQAIQDAMAVYYELTHQRDLAVGALIGIENFAVQPWAGMATEALSTIKESEGK